MMILNRGILRVLMFPRGQFYLDVSSIRVLSSLLCLFVLTSNKWCQLWVE